MEDWNEARLRVERENRIAALENEIEELKEKLAEAQDLALDLSEHQIELDEAAELRLQAKNELSNARLKEDNVKFAKNAIRKHTKISSGKRLTGTP